MTQKELEDYLWGAANILRGMIDAADFKQYIFPLLFFKRISDLWDEEYKTALDESNGDLDYASFAENHRFQIPKGCHWEDVRKKTVDVGAGLQRALNEIEKANFEILHDVFGDAQWTNKRRMSDEKMLDLIEHFSQMNLSVQNVPHDIMGDGYEYLIKKFADDSGHTAAEFYTNRTVVKLMTQITNPQPGESIYDPTCGSGGILLNSVLHVKAQGKEFRTLKLYGQEWEYYTKKDAKYGIAHQVLENIFQSLINLNIKDVKNEPNIHIPSIGCINDMCMDKTDVMVKLRAADICDSCLDRAEEENVNPSVLEHIKDSIEGLREAFVTSGRIKSKIKPLEVIIDPKRNVKIGDKDIHIIPLQRVLFIFFLKNLQGIKTKYVADHEDELYEVYKEIRISGQKDSIKRMFYPYKGSNPSFDSIKSKLNKNLIQNLGPRLADHYIIDKVVIKDDINIYKINLEKDYISIAPVR
jgi:hypothetical protein